MGCNNSRSVEVVSGNVVEDKKICVGKHWTDCGKKDRDTEEMEAQEYAAMQSVGWDLKARGTVVEGMRAYIHKVLTDSRESQTPEAIESRAIYDKYKEQVKESYRNDVGGPEYHPNAEVVDAYIFKKKGSFVNQRCLVFFHGGGGIAGNVEQFNWYCWRMCVDYDATIISVNYRLAPEHKIPCGIDDSYAAVKWTIAKAHEIGINPNKIATIGESGGSLIVAGVSMRLGEADEGHLIKFGAQLIPMVSNKLLLAPESQLDEMALVGKGILVDVYEALCDNYLVLEAGNFTDKWLFPVCIEDELCKKCPPAVIFTAEFDTCLQGAKDTAEVYRRNNNLLVYGSIRGSHHTYHYNPLHVRTNAWHKAFAKICRKYL